MDEGRMGTGTGAGTETRAVAEMGTERKMGTGTGTRTGSWRVGKRRRSARNYTSVVDAMREMGKTWVERGKDVDRKGWLSSCQPK